MTPSHQITMLKFIKNMSMCSTVLDSLHSADAIDFLIDVLSLSMKKGQTNSGDLQPGVEYHVQPLPTQQGAAGVRGQQRHPAAAQDHEDRPASEEFVLPILCDMAHSGSKGRRYLWQNSGLDFYVSLWQTSTGRLRR